MFYAYELKSLNYNFIYKGHAENLEERLVYHNKGKVKLTKHRVPYKVAYFEIFKTREEAIERERYFKTSSGRRFLAKILKDK